MKSKKAVTEVVLMIGVVLMAAVIISIGAGRIIAPLIKTEPKFQALDLAATINAAYTAPEDFSITVEPKRKEGVNKAIFIKGSDACIDTANYCRSFAKDTAATTTEFTILNKVIVTKNYDEKTRKNSLKGTK